MKKKLLLPFLAAASISLHSCTHDYQKAPNGMLYIKYTDNDGPKIKAGDFVSVNIIAKTDLDSLIGSTYEQGIPKFITLPKPIFAGDYFDALTLMTAGDSLSVKMSMDSIFKKSARPPGFRGNYIIYNLKVLKTIPKGSMTDKQLQEKANFFLKNFGDSLKNREPLVIKKFIDSNKISYNRTDSGLYYSITKKGAGPSPVPGDTAVINYTGRLFNGKIFDTNIKANAIASKTYSATNNYAPSHFPIDKTKAFAGINEGLLLLSPGSKATFIIPSKLAYGAEPHYMIGPYTPIVFEIELLSIIHPRAKK